MKRATTLLKMCENFGTKLFQVLRWSFLTGFTVLEFHDTLSQMKITFLQNYIIDSR